jgi:hypothetical protein
MDSGSTQGIPNLPIFSYQKAFSEILCFLHIETLSSEGFQGYLHYKQWVERVQVLLCHAKTFPTQPETHRISP